MTLRIYTLGALGIIDDDVSLLGFMSDEVKVLLLYMASARRTMGRDKAASLLASRGDLNPVLQNLSELVGSYVEVSTAAVGIRPGASLYLDSQDLEDGLSEAEDLWRKSGSVSRPIAQKIDRAVKLYEGPFLQGVSLPGPSGLTDWVNRERQRLLDRVIDSLERLIDYYDTFERTSAGERNPAYLGLEYANQLLSIDPKREASHRKKMLMLAKLGNQQQAEEQYEACRRMLSGIGKQPSRETVALMSKIQAGEIKIQSGYESRPTTILSSTSAAQRATTSWEQTGAPAQPAAPPPAPDAASKAHMPTRPAMPLKVRCANCGLEIPATAKVCEHCGEPQHPSRRLLKGRRRAEVQSDDDSRFGLNDVLEMHFSNLREPVVIQFPANGELVLGRVQSGDKRTIDLTPMGGQQHGVSRQHALIQRRGDTLVISDLNSSNGLFVNNQRITAPTVRLMRHGDDLRLGKLHIHIRFNHQD